MAGTNELQFQETEDSFQWDEHSQLYYHASTGFYHDPVAGWYYRSKDGLYFKFENGNYVPWETDQADVSNPNQSISTVDDDSYNHAHCTNEVMFFEDDDTQCLTNDVHENVPPPSEWLEDTLIELYLSGYSSKTMNGAEDNSLNIPTGSLEDDNADELEEGEWIPEETHEVVDERGLAADEDVSVDLEEEMWRAQYGQPIHLDKELVPAYPVVDLWDWSVVKESKRRRKHGICRLVGRLVKRTTKPHPSMPSSGRVLKTAPICEVHLDLVRVRSGRVYKLRSPKAAYLASLSSYDSSNPTKDWGLPELSMVKESQTLAKSSQRIEPTFVDVHVEKVGSGKDLSLTEKGHVYRDRAAERRTLHGGFGVGPGQKKSADDVDSAYSSSVSATPEEAASEALRLSFGDGSYARRILETMGWTEGDALGSRTKGITEPLQAVGNKGNSGLGWNQNTNLNRI